MMSTRLLGLLACVLLSTPAAADEYDVVVYGATAGGAIAAIAAAEPGVRVALVEQGRHVGGMVSGGLGRTDFDRQEHVIGGLAREFFERVGQVYGQPVAWRFEPKVAERTFTDWLHAAGVAVFFDSRIEGIEKIGATIRSIRTAGGRTFAARVFVDASYEGDLMTLAGVPYVIGREGRDRYGESLAGRLEFHPNPHQFRAPVSAVDGDGRLLPYVQPLETIGPPGHGDGRIQAYCFRLCLTDDPANRIPIARPDGYDPARYELVRRYLGALGDQATLRHFFGIQDVPNRKTDFNSGGPVSTNLLGAAWEYPDASPERRQAIWQEHLTWTQGLLYFLGNDPSVPERVRADMRRYGLPKDEFLDTGGWPHQLYVREGRRMLGEYVLTQHDLETHRSKYDAIGMGGYNIDIREVQWVAIDAHRFPDRKKEVLVEGYLTVPVEPWAIPYRSLLPRVEHADNLLVTSCISASHVAYSSFRMEPQYMLAGHSAGAAAAQAVRTSRPVHAIDLPQLQATLRAQGQILTTDDVKAREAQPAN